MPWNSLNWATNIKFGLDSLELFTILLMQLKCMVTVHRDCTLQDLICCWEYPTAIRRCPSSSRKCFQAVFGLPVFPTYFFFFFSVSEYTVLLLQTHFPFLLSILDLASSTEICIEQLNSCSSCVFLPYLFSTHLMFSSVLASSADYLFSL